MLGSLKKCSKAEAVVCRFCCGKESDVDINTIIMIMIFVLNFVVIVK